MEEEETSFVVVDGVVVPESALLQRERGSRYGSVPELPDEELADPEELERQIADLKARLPKHSIPAVMLIELEEKEEELEQLRTRRGT